MSSPVQASGSSATLPKTAARVAVFSVDSAGETVLRECFRQFNIDIVRLDGDVTQRLFKEKFEACVVPLDHPDAALVLETARTSPSNKRVVVYAIAADSAEALKFSKFGLNVVLNRPLERQSTLKAVRSSHLLVLHELRRYVRLPVVIEVALQNERGVKGKAMSQEFSAGGMSMISETKWAMNDSVSVSFALPNSPKMSVRAQVCWSRPYEDRPGATIFGVRYQLDDDRRLAVKQWIDSYLDIR